MATSNYPGGSRPLERQYRSVSQRQLPVVGGKRRLRLHFGGRVIADLSQLTELSASGHYLALVCNPVVAACYLHTLCLLGCQLHGLGCLLGLVLRQQALDLPDVVLPLLAIQRWVVQKPDRPAAQASDIRVGRQGFDKLVVGHDLLLLKVQTHRDVTAEKALHADR